MKKEKNQPQNIEKEEVQTEPSVDQDFAQETEQMQKLKQEKDDVNDKILRIMAEYDNFRKRTAKEKENIYPDVTAATVKSFLPVIDNFERALSIPCADEEFKKGIDMIFASIVTTLEKLGVESFGEVGDVFSPDMHNAVMHIEDDNYQEREIVEVMQKGYKIKDKIIRYAMVKVAN